MIITGISLQRCQPNTFKPVIVLPNKNHSFSSIETSTGNRQMHLSIGTFFFIIKQLPDTWLTGDTARRLALFETEQTEPPRDSFLISIVDKINHPSHEQFQRVCDTLFFNNVKEQRQFFITDEMKSEISWKNRTMAIEMLPSPKEDTFDNLWKLTIQLRMLTSFLTVMNGGIPLHSSSITKNAAALVFFGKSGAGKTTIARIMMKNGWKLLNDEYNVLLPCGDSFRVFSTPFTRRNPEELHVCTEKTHISTLFHLNRGPFQSPELSDEKKMEYLLKSVYIFPNFETVYNKLLVNVASISKKFSIVNLSFEKKPETANLIEKHLKDNRK